MKKLILISSSLIILLLVLVFTLNSKKEEDKLLTKNSTYQISDSLPHLNSNESNQGFVVLELFTSQGCSSCPPADEVLKKYFQDNNPSIFPLSFHVDYWNYIGWKDPFSKPEFSERQRNYSKNFSSYSVYTPQIIINGKHELVGSKENEIDEIVKQELIINNQSKVTIEKTSLENEKLNISYNYSNVANSNLNIALVKKKEFTAIKRGENKGHEQTNYNIVFEFLTVLNANLISKSVNFNFKKEWIESDFIVVAYLQNNKTGKISAAVKSEIK